MKTLIIIGLLAFVGACGKTATTLSTNSNGIQGSPIQGMQAVLFLPNPNLVGGGMTLNINSQNILVNISGSSPQASQYLAALNNNQVPVQPLSYNSNGRYYRVNYQGSIGVSACPFNPTAQCNTVTIQAISAY